MITNDSLNVKAKEILSGNFSDGDGWFIGRDIRCAPLPSSYFTSADILVNVGLSDEIENFVVAPSIFLYRHAVELALKELLLILGVKNVKHSIEKLTYKLIDELSSINDSFIPSESVFFAIMQFHALSPSSTEFRYDNQIKSEPSILGKEHSLFCNLKNAQFNADLISTYYRKTKSELKKYLESKV